MGAILLAIGALFVASASAQVSERVVRELIALPKPTEYEWQHLVMGLQARQETDLAILVLDANRSKTTGGLYDWHRKNRDVERMLHEVRASYASPQPLPKVVEDAIIHGGHYRAMQAYDYVREHSLPLERNYLLSFTQESGMPSPEIVMYSLLAHEGRAEDARTFLTLISSDEIRRYRDHVFTLLYWCDSSLMKQIVDVHPGFLTLGLIDAKATKDGDAELKELTLKEVLFGGPQNPGWTGIVMRLALEQYLAGNRHTAIRLSNIAFTTAAEWRKGRFSDPLLEATVPMMVDLGLGDKLEAYARDVLASARDRVQAGMPLVEESSQSPSEMFAEAVLIYVYLGMDSEAESILTEFDALYRNRASSMGLVDASLRGVKVKALINLGRYEDAINLAHESGMGATQHFVVGEALRRMISGGELDEARSLLRSAVAELSAEGGEMLGLAQFYGLNPLVTHLRMLGMQDEAKLLIKSASAKQELAEGAHHTFNESAFYAASGDWRNAKESMRLLVAQDPFQTGYGFSGHEFGAWKDVAGHDASALARVGADDYVRAVLKHRIMDGKFTERWPGDWTGRFVTALKHVQENRRMRDAVLGELETLLAAIPQGARPDVDYYTLKLAIQGPVSYPDAEVPQLRRSLQDRVLDAILKTRPNNPLYTKPTGTPIERNGAGSR